MVSGGIDGGGNADTGHQLHHDFDRFLAPDAAAQRAADMGSQLRAAFPCVASAATVTIWRVRESRGRDAPDPTAWWFPSAGGRINLCLLFGVAERKESSQLQGWHP